MKLSKPQQEVLQHMAEGHKLCQGRGEGGCWLDGVPADLYTNKRVHAGTLYALDVRGLIERAYTETTPWYRRDYVITQAGREALDK